MRHVTKERVMDFFSKKDSSKKEKPSEKKRPSRKLLGGANPRNREALDAAGMKKGGVVKKPGAGRYC
jgi:hypothetical protein